MKEESFLMRAEIAHDEDEREGNLRPKLLSEFKGQPLIRENLSVFIEAARARKEALDHLFLIGPPGLGKTTLAQITANELGVDFKVTSAPALDKPKDLAGILSTITERTVFFIDEIHRLKPAIEEMLYIAMEDYELDWIIGQGPTARTVRIPIPPFTLVGATTKAGTVSSPLISRFGIVERFSFYPREELASIVCRSASILGVAIDEDAALLIADCSRGTPRVANRVLRRMRDFALFYEGRSKNGAIGVQSGAQGAENGARTFGDSPIAEMHTRPTGEMPHITMSVVKSGLNKLQIDSLGLERYDREILLSIIQKFGGGPVGAATLAISIGETLDTLEDYYEPYLIQCGLIQRTPRGRIVTEKAYEHLGIKGRQTSADERLLF